MQNHASYSTLWGLPTIRATRDSRPFASDAEARAFRDRIARELIAAGCKVRRTSLRNQVRPYWGFGEPCGEACTVYKLEIISRPARAALDTERKAS